MNKKGIIIVIICVCVGILMICLSFFGQWMIVKDDISFKEWFSARGNEIILTVVLEFGLSIISAALFLLFVESSLNSMKDKDAASMQESKWKAYIIKKMRSSPKEALDEIRLRDNIPNALFTNQIFNGCDFSNCVLDALDFSGSSFINTNFNATSCVGCIFSSCNFENANFSNANLSYAVFTNAQNLSTLESAKALFHATMVDGTIYDNTYNLAEDLIQAQKLGQ